jgi:hypothetical protein
MFWSVAKGKSSAKEAENQAAGKAARQLSLQGQMKKSPASAKRKSSKRRRRKRRRSKDSDSEDPDCDKQPSYLERCVPFIAMRTQFMC